MMIMMMTRTPMVTTIQDDDFSDVDGRGGGGDDVDDDSEDVLHPYRKRNDLLGYVLELSLAHYNWNQTHKGGNQRSKDVTQVQQQRPESPTATLTWHASKYKAHKLHQWYILCVWFFGVFFIITVCFVILVEFMYLAVTRMPGESYRRRLRSLLLYLCYVFRALINPFTAPGCKTAELKDARTCLQTVHFPLL